MKHYDDHTWLFVHGHWWRIGAITKEQGPPFRQFVYLSDDGPFDAIFVLDETFDFELYCATAVELLQKECAL